MGLAKVAIATGVWFYGSIAMAAPVEVQKCVMVTGSAAGGYIPTELYFVYDAAAKTIKIDDAIVEYFNKGQPVDGTVTKDDGIKLGFRYSVFMVNERGQDTKMVYSATLFRSSKEIAVMARPSGYPNSFDARGKCAPYKG